eukprot:14600426-Alexandrium_andersonii.AAC.1
MGGKNVSTVLTNHAVFRHIFQSVARSRPAHVCSRVSKLATCSHGDARQDRRGAPSSRARTLMWPITHRPLARAICGIVMCESCVQALRWIKMDN